MKYQFQVFNKYINVIVTISVKDENYAKTFAKNCLIEFYGKTEEEVKELECVFICGFVIESLIDINLLEKQKIMISQN